MYDKLMKHTVVLSVVFAVIAMSFMFYEAYHAPIEIEETDDGENTQLSENVIMQGNNEKELSIAAGQGSEAYLCIPIDSNVTDDKLSLDADYAEQQLCVTIKEQKENFYNYNKISGNAQQINKVLWNYKKDTTQLLLQLNGVYEHKAFCKNNMLYIEFSKPRDKYDKIIVLDAGEKSSKYTQEVVKVLKDKLSYLQWNMKVYYIGMDNSDTSAKKKVALANQAKADMFISIQVTEDEENKMRHGIQTIYNPTYFIPSLSSIDLGDILEQNVCKTTKALGNGMVACEENDILVNEANVPVSVIQIGFLSNKQDKALLDDSTYIDQIAEGICNGIQDAYLTREKRTGK